MILTNPIQRFSRLFITLLGFVCFAPGVFAQASLDAENELLLELRLNGERLGLDILGYQRGQEFLVSLHELVNGLGFPIAVDGTQGSANGWYISIERSFSLDLNRAEVVTGGQKLPLAEGEVVSFDGDLFVTTDSIQKWFPLRLSTVVRELYLDVEPTETLPIQKRMLRRKAVSSSSSADLEPRHPIQQNPYRWFGPHITRLRVGSSTSQQNSDSEAKYQANYALLSRGDLGLMTSSLSLSGHSDDVLTGARLKLERSLFDGPLGLNQVQIGDVDGAGFRGFLLRGSSERGDQQSRFNDETISIDGAQLPDWEVELYQNGQLIETLTIEQDGRYLFEDVSLLFGGNNFEIRSYGPFGEYESREEYHFLGADLLKPGQLNYELSAVENGHTVFNLTSDDEREGGLYSANFSIGISRNLNFQTGFNSQEQEGERITSHDLGIGFSTSRFYSSLRYLDAPSAQNAVDFSLRTQFGGTNIDLGYTDFEANPTLTSSPNKWLGNLDIKSTILSQSILLKVSTREQENDTQFDAVLGTTAKIANSGYFSTSLNYDSVETRTVNSPTIKTSQTSGQLSFSTTRRPWAFRVGASYRFAPERELVSYSAESSLRIERDMTLNLSVRKNPLTDTTYYRGGLNWQFKVATISARVNYDSTERWTGLLSLSTSLVHQPGRLKPLIDSLASVDAGTVEVRVFADEGGEGDTPIQGAKVSGVQAWRKATTDSRGVAILSRMPANQRVDIELDESTITDGEMRSTIPGVSIISRPGSYAIVNFPTIRTVELSGHVRTAEDSISRPISRALVTLENLAGEVVAQRRTAFDGFYLFDGIEPGAYQLVLEDTLTQRIVSRPERLQVQSAAGVIDGLDFRLRPRAGRSIAPKETNPISETLNQSFAGSDSPGLSFTATPATEPVSKALPLPISEAGPSGEITPLDVPAQAEGLERAPPAANGNWIVQIGVYRSRARAEAAWAEFSQRLSVFEGKIPSFEPYRSMVRLVAGPGQYLAEADQLCQQFKAAEIDCFVRRLD